MRHARATGQTVAYDGTALAAMHANAAARSTLGGEVRAREVMS
jgi:hypothetical protein